MKDGSGRTSDEPDAVLSETTLKVYRCMISRGSSIGLRELQRLMHFSSPGLATFHLEKLVKAGLVSKSDDGSFSIDRVYLKHYVRVRRFLIPRYMFYATLATAFLVGWLVILSIPSTGTRSSFWTGLHTGDSFILITTVMYGVIVSLSATIIFWLEAIRTLRNDKI